MNDILSQLATALVVALVPVAIGAIGYLVRSVISLLKAKATREQFAILEQVATAAVQAVEQTLKSAKGAEKKAAALAVVRSALLKKGIALDEAQIEAAIESAVYIEAGIRVDLSAVNSASAVTALPEVDGDVSFEASTGAAE